MNVQSQDFFSGLMDWFREAAPVIAMVTAVLAFILLIIVLILIGKQNKLKKRLDFFMTGEDEEPLEETLRRVVSDNQKTKVQLKNNNQAIERINENLLTAYRKTGIVKYNAFPGMAGKMSSSIALLNNENNGIIISSIHNQDGSYTYVKEIMNGKSVNPLSAEDEEALHIAMQG